MKKLTILILVLFPSIALCGEIPPSPPSTNSGGISSAQESVITELDGDSDGSVADSDVIFNSVTAGSATSDDIYLTNGGIVRVSTTTDGHTMVYQVYDADTTSWLAALTFENGDSGDADYANWPRIVLGTNVVLSGLGNAAIGLIWGSDISTNTAITYTGANQMYLVTAAVTVTLPDVGTASDDASYGDRIWLMNRDAAEVVTVDLDDADKFNFQGFAQAAGATIAMSGAPNGVLECVATTDTDGSGTDGWCCQEYMRPEHIAVTFDPSWAYDQESTYRSLHLFDVGDDMKEGIRLHSWMANYIGGDPLTELDADLICDTTPDWNTAAGATVMDVLDTTAGASSATSGFDSATCAYGSKVYIHFGSDPTDANVMIALDIRFYK